MAEAGVGVPGPPKDLRVPASTVLTPPPTLGLPILTGRGVTPVVVLAALTFEAVEALKFPAFSGLADLFLAASDSPVALRMARRSFAVRLR